MSDMLVTESHPAGVDTDSRRWATVMGLFRRKRRPEAEAAAQEADDPAEGAPWREPAHAAPPEEPWRPVASEFADRVLMLVWAAVSHLAEVESTEQDPGRLGKLYRTDHALARIRRLAENLQVLAGAPIDDPGCQITTVLDVVRAAASAVQDYQRITIGAMVDLAVAEVAADDVIRVLTELIDNAVRYSAPATQVTVSAHLTDAGHVLIRVEDSGIGVDPAQLPQINLMLDDTGDPSPDDLQAAHLGLPVVARLTRRHRSLRVRLSPHHPAGTTAMMLVGDELVCEVPRAAGPAPTAVPMPAPALVRSTFVPAAGPRAGVPEKEPESTVKAPLPRRVPSSIRNERPQPPPAPRQRSAAGRSAWHDDAADFNAGVDSAAQAR